MLVDGIVKYMSSRAGPSSKELKTVEDVESFLNKDYHRCVGMFLSLNFCTRYLHF